MAVTRTESVSENSAGLDIQPADTVLSLLAEGQIQAAAAVRGAIPSIAAAAALVAATLARNGRLIYAAAGSSGLMALADALELPGTYGIARERIVVLIAGGRDALVTLAGAPEDDDATVTAELANLDVGSADCVIVLSASGTTPYAVAALDAAVRLGASTIGIANNAGTPVVTQAQVGIVLATPPELIAGSTRMGAGTAQKIALNMLSTLAAIRLGHVHDGYMVNLQIENTKLRDRAARIVVAITGCSAADAHDSLKASRGAVKPAVLIASGSAPDAASAESILAASGQSLRAALSRTNEGSGRSHQNRT